MPVIISVCSLSFGKFICCHDFYDTLGEVNPNVSNFTSTFFSPHVVSIFSSVLDISVLMFFLMIRNDTNYLLFSWNALFI